MLTDTSPAGSPVGTPTAPLESGSYCTVMPTALDAVVPDRRVTCWEPVTPVGTITVVRYSPAQLGAPTDETTGAFWLPIVTVTVLLLLVAFEGSSAPVSTAGVNCPKPVE